MKHKPDLMTFTMYFDDRHYSEREEAAECAKMLGTHHFEQEVHADVVDMIPTLLDAFDEPFGDDSMIPTYLLCKMARKRMTVALSGDGGDELFAGYRTYIADKLAPFYRIMPGFARNAFEKHILEGAPSKLSPRKAALARNFARAAERPSPYEHFGWTELFKEDVKNRLMSERLREQLNGHSSAESYVKAYKEAGHRRGLERFLYVDQQTHLADEFLVKMDRCSMANSLEVRPPLLDNDLVEFAAEIPEHYKLRGFSTKWILRRLMKGRLPDRILHGKKRGFGSPMWTWVTGPLLPLLRERFDPKRIANNPYLTPGEPMRLLDLVLTGRQELARRVFSLFLFVEWYERHGNGR
jgi:asparagine synthase (glutamine-hydrolysing)